MGKLRTEPKQKSFLSPDEFDGYLSIIREAQEAAVDHRVFFDLDKDEQANHEKKAFMYVAKREGIELSVRRVRGEQTLAFTFKDAGSNSGRMSAKESKNRILKCLSNAGGPMKKNQIIKETGISASTWNLRIKELLKDGTVLRHGDRRDTTYTPA